jgi:hypothetical protein
MRIALRSGPDWVVLPASIDLPPERVTVLRPSGFAGAPPGESRIELKFEVMNLHPAPGRHLEVTVPLTVRND